MKNLAGREDCDRYIREELEQAGVEIVEVGPSGREVPYTIEGKIGPFRLWRAWYYWIVQGYTPINVAIEIFASPRGRDVRTAGYSGNYDPEKWVASEREKYIRFRPYLERNELPPEFDVLKKLKTEEEAMEAFVSSMEDLKIGSSFIGCYHIDSQAGLNFFVDTIKKHGLDKDPSLYTNKGGYIGAWGRKFGSLQDGAPDSERRNEGAI